MNIEDLKCCPNCTSVIFCNLGENTHLITCDKGQKIDEPDSVCDMWEWDKLREGER